MKTPDFFIYEDNELPKEQDYIPDKDTYDSDYESDEPLTLEDLKEQDFMLECILMGDKCFDIWDAEYDIDPEEKLYLITFSPDPKRMPDCDFDHQHRFYVNTLELYLRSVEVGLWCVEASQMGRPHYHGWYQCAQDKREKGRIVMIKLLERFGNVKITESYGKFKVGVGCPKKGNCLWYYKKDLLTAQLDTPHNPIKLGTKDDTDWQSHSYWFNIVGRKQASEVAAAVTQMEFYKKFYEDSSL